jgi:uncharacterized circularly permuted ATP-grasp superfamily protein/uncharacterized alpha-E superfamily protein
MMAPDGSVRPAWAGLAATLDELGSEDVRRRKQALAEQLRLNGVTYNVYGDSRGADRVWTLDPIPMILESAEWEAAERGLIQRAELLDAILRDVYGPRRLVREGLIPALFLYSHPGFQRACSGNPATRERMLRFYSADLARAADGGFRVVSDRGQNPSGYGYALENRSVLGRTLPSLFRQSGVHRLDGFFRAFRKSLAEAAPPGVKDPFVVLMSPGPENETYFEQAYLASYLGLPLVRGPDLTPKDGGVCLPSLGGHRRVDVILRRVDDTFCDPLELNGSSLLGVPGLLQAVRNRKVTVCNALGSGILGGSGLMPFLPAICRHLFGQDLILPSVGTYWCGDREQREAALERFDELVIKPLYQGPKRSTWFVHALTREQREKLLIRIRAKPQLYLAQEVLRPSAAPCFIADRLEARSLVLRSFLAASGGSYSVMPGGLSRVASRADSVEVTGQGGGISKDTWILSSEPVGWGGAPELSVKPLRPNRHQGPLPAYAAENLFWFGRYQERLSCQARVWRGILKQAGEWPYPAKGGAMDWVRILQAFQPSFSVSVGGAPVGGATGGEADGETPAAGTQGGEARILETRLGRSLREESTLGSPAFNRAALRRAARAVRDLLPDDCWLAVNSLLFEEIGGTPDGERASGDASIAEAAAPDRDSFGTAPTLGLLDRAILDLGGLAGLGVESIALGPVRRFIAMGRHVERALCTARVLSAALSGNLKPRDPLLKSLLDFHDSDLLYRQRYQQDVQAGAVADLLVADEINPRSIAFQLARFTDELAQLPLADSALLTACHKTALKALTSVRVFETGDHGGITGAGGNEAFEHLLSSLETWLGQISDCLSREFFQPIPMPQSLREWT